MQIKVSTSVLWLGLQPLPLPEQMVIRQGTLGIVIEEVLWSIRGSYQTMWSSPLTNAKWHSVAWSHTLTTLHRSDFKPIRDLFTELWEVSINHLWRVWHAYRGHLLLRTLGPVPNVVLVVTNSFPEVVVIFSDYAIRTSLGTFSIFLMRGLHPL